MKQTQVMGVMNDPFAQELLIQYPGTAGLHWTGRFPTRYPDWVPLGRYAVRHWHRDEFAEDVGAERELQGRPDD